MEIHVTRDHDRGIETTQRTLLKCAIGTVTIGDSTMKVRDVEVRDKPVETKIAILSELPDSKS